MKEIVMNGILNDLVGMLDNVQLNNLKNVMEKHLNGKNIVIEDNDNKIKNDNSYYLEIFLTAKHIEGCSDKTIKYYRNTLEHFIANIDEVCNVTTEMLRKYLLEYEEDRKTSKTTLDNIRRIISSFFTWLEDENYIIKSPARRIHKIKSVKSIKNIYSDEELEKMRDASDNKRDLAIIDILSSTGMRVGELVKINLQDLDLEKRECKVTGKGNKERIVYFDARTKIHLEDYIDSREDNSKALFVSLNSPFKRLGISGVELRLKELGTLLNIEKVHPHKFRRTLATKAIDKGMPIEQVQVLLGHNSIDTTLHYAQVNQKNVKFAHSKYIG